MFQRQAASITSDKIESTHHSPLSGCPAAPSGARSQCEDAPHSARPAGETSTVRTRFTQESQVSILPQPGH